MNISSSDVFWTPDLGAKRKPRKIVIAHRFPGDS